MDDDIWVVYFCNVMNSDCFFELGSLHGGWLGVCHVKPPHLFITTSAVTSGGLLL